jgi:hypothetical protein
VAIRRKQNVHMPKNLDKMSTFQKSSPIELREFYRLWLREDALRGVAPVRLPTGPLVDGVQPFDLFVRVGLQYRTLGRVEKSGAKAYEWSEWQDCATVLEEKWQDSVTKEK